MAKMNKKVFAISVIVLLVDQVSKGFIDAYFTFGRQVPIIKHFFYIMNCHNEGAAWSIFTNQKIFILICTFLALLLIYRYLYVFKLNARNNVAFGLLIGGIVGNLIDRVLFGYVRDFLDFYLFSYDYPVFNFADVAIVIGVFLLFIAIIKGEDVKDATDRGTRHKKEN